MTTKIYQTEYTGKKKMWMENNYTSFYVIYPVSFKGDPETLVRKFSHKLEDYSFQ